MRALTCLVLAALGAGVAGCAEGASSVSPPPTSTLEQTLVDPDGDGRLERGPGEPLVARRELSVSRRASDRRAPAPASRAGVSFVQLTDLHLRD